MMEQLAIILPIIVLVAALGTGMPVAFGLVLAGVTGVAFFVGIEGGLSYLGTVLYRQSTYYSMIALPLFVLMGILAGRVGIARKLFDAAYTLVGRLTGGLANASIVASAMFAALSGSSVAAAAAFSPIIVSEMTRLKYDEKLSVGIVAASGTFATMIPPSINFLFYGFITNTSVGKLFMAGILPGILTALLYMISVIIRVKRNPALAPKPPSAFTTKEKLATLVPTWPALIIIVVVLGGIYLGVFTPTEAASIGALAVIILGLASRQLSMSIFKESIVHSAKISAMCILIIGGAFVFGYYLSVSGITPSVTGFIKELEVPRLVILGAILTIHIVLGTIMENFAIMGITLPMTFPIIVGLGFDPVWFGVLVLKTCEIGLVSPPLGLNCYVVQAATGVPLEKVFAGIFPFILVDIIVLAILVAFPQISLFIPGLMG